MIINIIKKLFSKFNKKDWLDKLVVNLETQKSKNVNLPFKIIELKNTGFVVKVSGLYAFISFYHMPWKYRNVDYWTAISPQLVGKVFYCRIHSIKKTPSLSIIIDGGVHQFKKTELVVGKNYRGIIVEKIKRGVFVDMGYHFGWRYGSFVGYLHKSQFDSIQLFSNCSVGDEIERLYQGLSENGILMYAKNNEIAEWNNGIPQSLIGQIVLVHIVREQDEKETSFLVNGKYRGRIIYDKNDCFFESRKQANKVKNKLKNGEIIHCEIIGLINKARMLKLKWIAELDAGIIDSEDMKESKIKENKIMNHIDNDTIQKLLAIRGEIESAEK